jgi:hypothetical protein
LPARLRERVTFDRGALAALALGLAGAAIEAVLVVRWIRDGFELHGIFYPGVFGLVLIVTAFQTFAFTLLVQILDLADR